MSAYTGPVKIRWSSTAALTALFVALVLSLGVVQWRWLYEIEGRDHFMRLDLVARSAELFKVTFDREIDELAEHLERAAGPPDRRARSLAGGLGRWRAGSEWPAMVAAVYLVEPARGETPRLLLLRESPDSGPALEPVPWPTDLRPLADSVPGETDADPPERRILPRALALVVPWPGFGDAEVVAVLDAEHLAARTFPDLVERFMPEPSFEATEVAVAETASDRVLYSTHGVDRVSDFGRADAVCGLVGWPGAPRVAEHPDSGPGNAWYRDLMDVVYFRGYWRVLVRYSDVPIPAEAAAARRRKAVAGFGLLALLATSLAMLTVSTRRAQRTARQQLEQLARVSHELRTPLTVLSSAGDNLADAIVSDTGEVRGYGRVIQRETRRLYELVENVLSLARRRAGTAGARTRVEVGALVDAVLGELRPSLEEAGFTVERSSPPAGAEVVGDPRALRSALRNLVSNAVRHAASGRWLGISVERRARRVRIAIADRGPGLEPEELPALFEPYVRGAGAAAVEGSGLGLAVVRDVIESHGGRVVAEAVDGGGARFVVTLPLAGAGERRAGA